MAFFADSGTYPPEAHAGEIPHGMERYLPVGFSFQRDSYVLDYDNWQLGPGDAVNGSNSIIGITVESAIDPKLPQTVMSLLGSQPTFGFGSSHTYVFVGL